MQGSNEAMSEPQTDAHHISKAFPVHKRAEYWLRLKIINWLQALFLTFRRLPAWQKPTYVKRYAVRPTLDVRVFVPKTYKAGDAHLPPLFIDIHGGGFCIGDPRIDDKDSAILSQHHGFCVASISYRKGPRWRFPTAPYDCAALIEAVLDDADIPADRSRVVVGGWSAGGNLSLAAVQLNELHKRVKAIVAAYPSSDRSRSVEKKLKTAKLAPGRKSDLLMQFAPLFNYGYVPPGTDTRDPLLSPYWADRGKLPKHIYLLGCEYDMLCKEAEDMAENLAGHEPGKQVLMDDGRSWEHGAIKWTFLPGLQHGFNQTPTWNAKAKREQERRTADMHKEIAFWLHDKVFKEI